MHNSSPRKPKTGDGSEVVQAFLERWKQQAEAQTKKKGETSQEPDASVLAFSPSLPRLGFKHGVVRNGDWVAGFDFHMVQATVPPIPLGIFPIPFIGKIQAKKRLGKKKVMANRREICAGPLTVDCQFSHLGPIQIIPVLSITDGSFNPSASIKPKHRQVRVHGKPLITSGDNVSGSCSFSKTMLKIITASSNVVSK